MLLTFHQLVFVTEQPQAGHFLTGLFVTEQPQAGHFLTGLLTDSNDRGSGHCQNAVASFFASTFWQPLWKHVFEIPYKDGY